MGIKKQIEFDNGIVAEYWRIESFTVINGSSNVQLNINLWKNKEVRSIEGKDCISSHVFHVDLDESMGIVLSNCYDKLKLLPTFEGAEDV